MRPKIAQANKNAHQVVLFRAMLEASGALCGLSRERERVLRPTQLQSQTIASPLEYLVTIIREHIKQAPSNERKTELPKHQ
jgi:uncharacterized membrane protein YcaP (DUF421 family)